jgi:hypothetical protein
MTVRSVSWTDAREVAALLTRITAPRPAPGRLVSAMGATAPRARPEAPARPAPPPVPVKAPRLVHTSDNAVDRLDALIAWTLANHRCAGAFVADDNGLTLAAHGISEAHVSIVGPLLSALGAARSIPGVDATAGAVRLGAQMMSWVEVRIPRGSFCLGTVGDEVLSTRSLAELEEALSETIRTL